MSSSTGLFVWHDLMTTDLGAAETFYRAVLGWQTRDSGMPDQSYTIASVGPSPVAGLMPIPEAVRAGGGSPTWAGYVAVEDVDAATAALRAAGGGVHRPPTDIPGVGRFAAVADPQGAFFYLFTPQGPAPEERPAPFTPGTPGWNELHAAEWQSAFAFYAGLFGWQKGETVDMGPMGLYQLFTVDGVQIGGMMTKAPAVPHPMWLYYFCVEAIDAAAGRVTAAGGAVLQGPHPVPGGSWIVQCRDPQGAAFALVGPRPEP